MKARAWNDEKSGWWLSDVQGCGMRVTGSGRTRQSAVDDVTGRGWKFCASIRELSEAGALPLAERRGLVTVEECQPPPPVQAAATKAASKRSRKRGR